MRLCKKEKLIKLVFYNPLFLLQNKIDMNEMHSSETIPFWRYTRFDQRAVSSFPQKKKVNASRQDEL